MAFLLCLGLGGCKKRGPEWRTMEGATWNTTYRITYFSDKDMTDSVQAVLRDIEQSLSPFNPHSIISAINRNETDKGDKYLARIFDVSRKVNNFSGGYFDPTVGPLVNLWGFGTDRHARKEGFEPTQEQIDSALALVGFDDCRMENLRMVKKCPGTQFNFSAITKGFGCDQVGGMMQANGIHDYMVEIGGELAVSGTNPRGKPWRISVDAPEIDEKGLCTHHSAAVIPVSNCGIATSGNYRNYRDAGASGRVGHIIDPHTGLPMSSDILSATIIAPTCAIADAYATACMAMPSAQEALKMIESRGVECMLITAPDFRVVRSSGFPRLRD